jgi:hypothetical protein
VGDDAARGGGTIAANVDLDPCPSCPAAYAAAPATIRHGGNGAWRLMPNNTPAHLLTLFRDPQIRDGRRVDVVLDLALSSTTCRTPPWVGNFIRALAELPVGLVVALDNGVRCPCGKTLGRSTYFARANVCLGRTRTCLADLRHPDSGRPGVVICDRDLADALAAVGTLALGTGAPWTSPDPWITAVGSEVTFLGEPALVLAHPVVLQRQRAYRDAVTAAVPKLVALARTAGSSAEIVPT